MSADAVERAVEAGIKSYHCSPGYTTPSIAIRAAIRAFAEEVAGEIEEGADFLKAEYGTPVAGRRYAASLLRERAGATRIDHDEREYRRQAIDE